MANEMEQKHSHRSILDLFGLTSIYLFLLFCSLPYAAAQSSNQPTGPGDSYEFADAFSPSMGIILVGIIIAFLILGFLSFCIGRPESGGESTQGGISRRGNRGLDPAVIDTFPTLAYSSVKDHKLGKGALECAVCLSEFEDEDTLRLLPKCDHVFHPDCIDAWLSKRTTCPVCRGNLLGETPATPVPVQDMEGDSVGEISISEPGDVENQQSSPQLLTVVAAPEVINKNQMQNRPLRTPKTPGTPRTRPTRPRFMGRFPRSHSTGHSLVLVQPGEDVERFTLRLPEEVRKQVMNMRHLNRTRSMLSLPSVGSPGKGNRMTGEGSSRGEKSMRGMMGEKPDGWVFSITPPFFVRPSPTRSPKMTAAGGAEVTPRLKPLRSPLQVSMKADGTEPSLNRPPI
ncbi:E3 ubiquitin-protein ligase ATL6-like [Macadamia integrifolia]|uniref:E3 ubiquitin-protein ligase ATL6-like n=1 Tax=Macadamia integrifolia TaxID=60698 RepID=UPI001C502088|nr:E3 ubiquitin-protein ligase ATL6-like [Macadamia integrifolia]